MKSEILEHQKQHECNSWAFNQLGLLELSRYMCEPLFTWISPFWRFCYQNLFKYRHVFDYSTGKIILSGNCRWFFLGSANQFCLRVLWPLPIFSSCRNSIISHPELQCPQQHCIKHKTWSSYFLLSHNVNKSDARGHHAVHTCTLDWNTSLIAVRIL